MNAAPFLNRTNPLHFRGLPDSLAEHHLEGSECCLIHADNPLSAKLGVWLNPLVRVGYNGDAYKAVNPMRGRPSWLPVSTILWSSWQNRLRRWGTTHWFKASTVYRRVASWKAQGHDRVERGIECIINEMQVLVENGWAHV